MQYNLLMTDGLYFAGIDGKEYLIDTGSPYTYSVDGEVFIDGKSHKNHGFEKALFLVVDALRKRFNRNICGIIGNDVLLESGFTLDKENGWISFYPENMDGLTAFFVSETEYDGLPFVIMNKLHFPDSEEELSFVIDTGTNISHIAKELCTNACYAEHTVRYYPALRKEIPADLFIFSFREDKKPFDIRAALTENGYLMYQMRELEADGFLSLSSLVNKRMVLDMKNKRIYLDNNEKKK